MTKQFILLLVFIIDPEHSLKEHSSPWIEWSQNSTLTWDDYKGLPESSGFAAISHIELRRTFEVVNDETVRLSVRALFNRDESWVKTEFADSILLIHEQGHFDLWEIAARRIRKEVQQLEFDDLSEINEAVKEIHLRTTKLMDETQETYDRETDYSRDQQSQQRWISTISRNLEELRDYSCTSVTIVVD